MFKPDEVSVWQSMLAAGRRGVRAHGCVKCHHLHFAVEFSEEDLAR